MVNWVYSLNWYKMGLDIDAKVNQWTDRIAESVAKKAEEKK